MPINQLKNYLDSHHIEFISISHSSAYSAQKIAASAHVPGKEMAKTVIVKIGDDLVMAVLPANYKIDFERLARAMNVKTVRLATEEEFRGEFPDCQVGAMPPFGNLYNMDVYITQSLAQNVEIAFNACSHRELIKMKYADYDKLVNPQVIKFSDR